MTEPAKEKWFSQTFHTYKPYYRGYRYEAHFEYHDTLLLAKSPIKWRQRPDMTIAVDLNVKHNFKQTNFVPFNRVFSIEIQRKGPNILNVG